MPPAGFEATIPAYERPLNHLDRAAIGIGTYSYIPTYKVLSQNTSIYL